MRKKRLTPAQTFQLNRTLRHLASELDRRKAVREAKEQARKRLAEALLHEAQKHAADIYRICREMAGT